MGKSSELFLQVRENDLQAGVSFEHLLDAKKSNIKTAVFAIEQAVKEGQYDELKALILAKKGSEFFSELEKAIRPVAEDAYVNRIGKDYSAHDTKVEAAETGVKYDFSACNDAVWNDINKRHISVSEEKKTRETFLKGVNKKITIVDPDSGEVSEISPPIRTGKLGLKLTIK